MAKNIGFGIIGAGMISNFHAQAIKDAAGAELVCVYCPEKPLLDAFVKKHNVKGYDTMEAFLADPALEAVTIATPTGLHLDTAVPAAKAGKHVLCEKPLEITPERSQEIIDACRESGVVLAPVFQYRYSPAARLIREAVTAGRFGKLLMGSAKIKWFRSQAYYDSGVWRGTWELDGGGCLMNQSIHAIDLFIHFMGRPVEIYGHVDTAAHERIQVEDNSAAVIKFDNGAFGTIESSTAMEPGWPLEVEVSGTRGTVCVQADTLVKWDFADKDPIDAKALELIKGGANNSGASDPSAISTLGHQMIIEDMVRAIRGESGFIIDGAEAKLPVEVVCSIYKSAKTGIPVKLN